MKRYQPSIPRAAFGVFAAAMTVSTLALAVVAPATICTRAPHEHVLATPHVDGALVARSDRTAASNQRG